jgi:hypothetical protein
MRSRYSILPVVSTLLRMLSLIKNPLVLFLLFNSQKLLALEQNPVNGLIADLPFNGNALDVSGNDHDGIVFNAYPTPDHFGKKDCALYLPPDAYIKGDSADDFPVGLGTFTFWIKNQDPHGVYYDGRAVFGYGGGSECNMGFKIFLNSSCHPAGNIVVKSNCDDEELVYVNPDLLEWDWFHVGVTRGAEETSLYINGVLVMQKNVIFNNTAVTDNEYVIGNVPDVLGTVIPSVSHCDRNGAISISSFKIFGYVLEQDEIFNLFKENPHDKSSLAEKYNVTKLAATFGGSLISPLVIYGLCRFGKFRYDSSTLKSAEQNSNQPAENHPLLNAGGGR